MQTDITVNECEETEKNDSVKQDDTFHDIIKADFETHCSYSLNSFFDFWKLYRRHNTCRYTFWLRAHKYWRSKNIFTKLLLFPLAHFRLKHYSDKYSVHIDGRKIGKGLCVVHLCSIYLNAESIGENFTVFHGVTVGEKCNGKPGKPVIKDNVTAYTGSVIVGNITLENNCRIAANSVVIKDVPENSVASGVPAVILNSNK